MPQFLSLLINNVGIYAKMTNPVDSSSEATMLVSTKLSLQRLRREGLSIDSCANIKDSNRESALKQIHFTGRKAFLCNALINYCLENNLARLGPAKGKHKYR